MELNIGITDVKDSNEFLRCLWSEKAKEFGNCGWQYIPIKDGSKKKSYAVSKTQFILFSHQS